MRRLPLGAMFLMLWLAGGSALAAENPVVAGLVHSDAYISPSAISAHAATRADLSRLLAQTRAATGQGVPEKIAIAAYPRTFTSAAAAASALRRTLGFSGVLILVARHDMGISSDKLSASEDTAIAQKVAPLCVSRGFTNCAIVAGRDAVTQIKDDQSTASRNALVFWIVVLGLLGLVIVVVVLMALRRRQAMTGRIDDLRRAASNTLSLADGAVNDIESATASGTKMSAGVRADYDRALSLRDRARTGLEQATSPEMLTQANQDAAQAVLALQGLMRSLGISSPLANPLEAPAGHRCFYCGHDDRPPYKPDTIDDGRGNSLQIEVCSVCRQRLEEGRRPDVATVAYAGSRVPWWAVPDSQYYYAYGGPSWQNWLPFLVGMDVGSWLGGGGYASDWDDRTQSAADWSAGGVDVAAPTDAGGADYGGWDTASDAGWDSGSDSGWDSGGDSGGWDSGGDSSGW